MAFIVKEPKEERQWLLIQCLNKAASLDTFWILLLCCTLLHLDAHLVLSLSHTELLDDEPNRAHQLTISHPLPCFGRTETSVMVKKPHFHLPFPSIITSLGPKGSSKQSGCLPKQLVHKQPIPDQTAGSPGCWALSIRCPAEWTQTT